MFAWLPAEFYTNFLIYSAPFNGHRSTVCAGCIYSAVVNFKAPLNTQFVRLIPFYLCLPTVGPYWLRFRAQTSQSLFSCTWNKKKCCKNPSQLRAKHLCPVCRWSIFLCAIRIRSGCPTATMPGKQFWTRIWWTLPSDCQDLSHETRDLVVMIADFGTCLCCVNTWDVSSYEHFLATQMQLRHMRRGQGHCDTSRTTSSSRRWHSDIVVARMLCSAL